MKALFYSLLFIMKVAVLTGIVVGLPFMYLLSKLSLYL